MTESYRPAREHEGTVWRTSWEAKFGNSWKKLENVWSYLDAGVEHYRRLYAYSLERPEQVREVLFFVANPDWEPFDAQAEISQEAEAAFMEENPTLFPEA